MNETLYQELSKTLSYFLRHKPDEIHLSMNTRGYVSIDEYIQHFNQQIKKPATLTKDMLLEIVKRDGQRYSISEDSLYIRANYGHSIPDIYPDLEPVIPPDILLHGTSPRAAEKIKVEGISKMGRNAVHLTDDEKEAERVGIRHCHKGEEAVILQVDTKRMHEDGIQILKTQNGKFLTDFVDPKYILPTV